MTEQFTYDVGIIGAGVAGAFAALRLKESHPNTKAIIFDIGRPPGKRRRQLEGWLGCFPVGDGKIYPKDIDRLNDIVDEKSLSQVSSWVYDIFNEVNPVSITKTNSPSASIKKLIEKQGLSLELNDYIQWKPKSIHDLSKLIAGRMEDSNVTFSFDNEVYQITKRNGGFEVITSEEEYFCKKIILCVGRSGWRWANSLFSRMNLNVNNDYATYGIKIEASSSLFKGFNKSHCSLLSEDLEIGPFSWNGTVIQEDHSDLVLSSFRSNEARWNSDKVSFSFLHSKKFPEQGAEQAERLAKLCFLLCEDRVGKEKIKNIMNGQSQICMVPEFNWLNEKLELLEKMIPNIINKGYFYIPDIKQVASPIILSKGLETEVSGLFVAGESMGERGVLSAAVTGAICVDFACG